MVVFDDGSNQRAESEISDWLNRDKMIVESLATAAHPNIPFARTSQLVPHS